MLSGYIIIDDVTGAVSSEVPGAFTLRIDPIKQRINKIRFVNGLFFTSDTDDQYSISPTVMMDTVAPDGSHYHTGIISILYPDGTTKMGVIADYGSGVMLAAPLMGI